MNGLTIKHKLSSGHAFNTAQNILANLEPAVAVDCRFAVAGGTAFADRLEATSLIPAADMKNLPLLQSTGDRTAAREHNSMLQWPYHVGTFHASLSAP